ncbi:MAG: hypothetical protein JWO36_6357 [Myxococcales bacterium]|nr:hypothetical protein [Myxococcales bacterium]
MKCAVAMLFVAVAACGDNTHAVQVDLTLGSADLILFRDGVGPWQSPDQIVPGSYALQVADDFELVAVFAWGDGSFYAEELAATYSEGSHWVVIASSQFGGLVAGKTRPASFFDVPCSYLPRTGTVKVTGTMNQPGDVAMGASCKRSASAPWSFSLDVPTGVHDLIATGSLGANGKRVSIVRAQLIDAPTTVPNVDLTVAGIALTPTPIAVANSDGDGATVDVTLSTTTDEATLSRSFGTLSAHHTIDAWLAPMANLQPTDQQLLEVHSPGGLNANPDRSARVSFTGNQTVFDLLPPPHPTFSVETNVEVASWSSWLDRYSYVDFVVDGADPNQQATTVQQVTASKGWIEAHHTNRLSFDTSIPGYLPAWTIDRTKTYARFFGVRNDSTDVTYMTTQRESVAGSAVRTLHTETPEPRILRSRM